MIGVEYKPSDTLITNKLFTRLFVFIAIVKTRYPSIFLILDDAYIYYMMEMVIEVEDLSHHFREIRAVDGLSFRVKKGEVYGFLGQNGAGKSTTIRMLLTLIKPSSGNIRIFGKNLLIHRKHILSRIGAMIEKPDLYKYLTAYENLSIFSRLSGMKPTQAGLMRYLRMVGLAERAHSKVKTFSQGMRQRLGIAVALVHDPELVILDEPTNGLDPQGISDVRNLVRHLSEDLGKTIFISSHLLTEIELIADSMLIIDKGKRVVEGRKDELLNPAKTNVELETTNQEKTMELLMKSDWNLNQPVSQNGMIILHMKKEDIPKLAGFLVSRQVEIISLRPKHSLEDFFLSLTAR